MVGSSLSNFYVPDDERGIEMKKTVMEIKNDVEKYLNDIKEGNTKLSYVKIGTAKFLKGLLEEEKFLKEEDGIVVRYYYEGGGLCTEKRRFDFDERFIECIEYFIEYIIGTKIYSFKYGKAEFSDLTISKLNKKMLYKGEDIRPYIFD